VHFGRGLAARNYFTYRDVVGFIYAQAKFQLLGKENSDDVAAGRRKALTFIEGRSVGELVALGEEVYDEIIADKIWAGTRELTQMHLDAGQQVWLITATPYELAATIVAALETGAVQLAPQGVAHGRSGVVLAALAWQAVSRSLPEAALARAVIAEYPYDVSALAARRRADWAHGHAGMAHLFARAYLQLGDHRFLAWAREAAAQAIALPGIGASPLDGASGIAYSLLAVAAADPEGPWRDAAWTVASQMFADVDVPATDPYGVWSGLGGACCLALDLIHETDAGFPGVEA